MRKILAILALTAAVLIALAALADPTIRYPYIGVQLERDLAALDGSDPMAVLISVETGTEVLPEDLLVEEPSIQDDYSLFMILREELKAQNESATVRYGVEQMESEQWAWQQAELNKLTARTQVYPQKIALSPTLEYPKEQIMASPEVWTPLITSFWPKLPEGLQKAGRSSWQEQLSYQEKNPMTGELTKINYNLVYRLDKFVDTERGLLANILVVGTIAEGSEVDPSVEVRGTIKGFVLVEPETGRAYGGEYRVEERFLIRQPGLPVFRKSIFQGAKFWRPMFYKMNQDKPSVTDLETSTGGNPEGVVQSPAAGAAGAIENGERKTK